MTSIIEAFQAALINPPTEVPEGWETAKGIAKGTGRSLSYTLHKLGHLVDSGTWETQTFIINTGKKVYPVPHYRPVDKPKKSK